MSTSPTRASRRSRSPLRQRRSRSPARRGGRKGGRDVRGKDCRVYVSNLTYDVKWMELKDVMKKHGNVEHVEIFTDPTGRSKGSGIVEYSRSEDAVKAIKELDGHEVAGRKIRLREDKLDNEEYSEQLRTQKEKSRAQKAEGMVNRGQGYGTGPSHMGPAGGGGGGGFRRNAAPVGGGGALGGGGGIGSLLGGGHAQLIQLLNSKGGDPINSNVFISNLDYDVSWQKLKDMFRRSGNCIRCDIAQDDDNRSKGFGSVQFETPFEALTAIAMFNGLELGLRQRKMSVRLDRASALHQVLEQLGVPSNEVTEKTIQQLQSIATLSTLTGAGGLGGLGGALSQLTALASYQNANLQSTPVAGTSALSGLAGLQGLGSALGGLQTLLAGGLGSILTSQAGSVSAGQSAVGNYQVPSSVASYGGVGGGGYGGVGGGSYGGGSSQSNRRDDIRSGGGNYGGNRSGGGGGGGGREPQSAPGCRVFVRNLPFSIKWQDLKDKFREAGRITHADIKTNEDGRSKGCGTITFDAPDDANRAVSLFNTTRMDGREIEVRIDRMN